MLAGLKLDGCEIAGRQSVVTKDTGPLCAARLAADATPAMR